MSKSDGEFLTVSLLEEKGYHPLAYRLFCLQSHYRKPLEFTWETLDNAVAAYDKLRKRIQRLSDDNSSVTPDDSRQITEFKQKFAEAMANDLNTSSAITVLYDMLKSDLSDASKRALAEDFDTVLSLGLMDGEAERETDHDTDTELAAYVEKKIAERAAAKAEKDFARADEIRAELAEKGIMLKDTREGTSWSLE